MLAYYGDRISPHMTDTPEGYLICHDVPIARIGEMDYLAGELQLDGDPERLVKVDRRAEDVFEDAALASFEGKDVTRGHPPEDVGPENFAAYSKGQVQNVRRGGDYVLADLFIKDAALISDIKSGLLREVSCGYLCRYAQDGGRYRQTHIRGNHVAVVPRGRAGREVAIQDAAGEAEKGRNHMSEFWKSILTAFGRAAKDAQPEELAEMVDTTARALDAAPGGKPEGEEPKPGEGGGDGREPKEETPEEAPARDALEEKLDRILSMLDAAAAKSQDAPEARLDAALSGIESGAATVGEGGALDQAAKDAAVRILKNARPVIAAMKDPEEKRKVTDALLEGVRARTDGGGAKLLEAAQAAADSARDAAPDDYSGLQREYDSRNPHMKKEGN